MRQKEEAEEMAEKEQRGNGGMRCGWSIMMDSEGKKLYFRRFLFICVVGVISDPNSQTRTHSHAHAEAVYRFLL